LQTRREERREDGDAEIPETHTPRPDSHGEERQNFGSFVSNGNRRPPVPRDTGRETTDGGWTNSFASDGSQSLFGMLELCVAVNRFVNIFFFLGNRHVPFISASPSSWKMTTCLSRSDACNEITFSSGAVSGLKENRDATQGVGTLLYAQRRCSTDAEWEKQKSTVKAEAHIYISEWNGTPSLARRQLNSSKR